MEPASLTDRDITELRDHGWPDRVIADVVGLVALNQLTGSFNLVAGLQPDTEPDTGRQGSAFRQPPDRGGDHRTPAPLAAAPRT